MNALLEQARRLMKGQATERRERERDADRGRQGFHRSAIALVDLLEQVEGLLAASDNWPADRLRMALGITIESGWASVEGAGITVDGSTGEIFDPARHKIVERRLEPGVPADRVVAVNRRGVACGSHRLRPASVVLSQGDSR